VNNTGTNKGSIMK